MTEDFYEDQDGYYDDSCWECGGEGYTYDCITEYACLYPEDGCDLCMRRCHVCNHKPNPELQQILGEALAKDEDAKP